MNLTLCKTIRKIEEEFSIDEGGLLRHNRSARVAEARHILMFYCMEVLKLRYKEAEYYLERDRTTIRHGVNRVIRKLVDGNRKVWDIIEDLRR
jgi:chromosomal replication initiation ATPase DnaA